MISLDATSHGHQNGVGATLTVSHTITNNFSGNGNDILIVCATAENAPGAPTITGVTFAGKAMTLAVSQASGAILTEIWYFLNPKSGPNNIVITYGGTYVATGCIGISLNGASKIQIDASASAIGRSAKPQVNITTTINKTWIIDSLIVDRTSVVVPNETQINNDDIGLTSHHGASYSPNVPRSIKMMGWGAGNVNDVWALAAVAIRPVIVKDIISSDGIVPFNR